MLGDAFWSPFIDFMSDSLFTKQLLTWFVQHGRHDLPWQVKDNPYQVWVSEIMLQQTQVKTVLQYFPRFIARFPDVNTLANATWDEVAPYWAGLGYYARARNLHKAAQLVAAAGKFPQNLEDWIALPGIGPSTAGALMSLGLGKFGVILDGNVKRVLARYFAIEYDLSKRTAEQQLWQLATQLTPQHEHAAYTQAIMDLGATICTPKKPLCLYCPMQAHCKAYTLDKVLDFPVKKIKKTVPIKHAYVLILQHEKRWLWYKRPEQGLWGGLYCLPMFEQQNDFNHFIQQWGLASEQSIVLNHHFTHFTWQLHCHKFIINARLESEFAAFFSATALDFNVVEQLALPRAMQKIMAKFHK